MDALEVHVCCKKFVENGFEKLILIEEIFGIYAFEGSFNIHEKYFNEKSLNFKFGLAPKETFNSVFP